MVRDVPSASGLSGCNEPKDYSCPHAAGPCETLPAGVGGNCTRATAQSVVCPLANVVVNLSHSKVDGRGGVMSSRRSGVVRSRCRRRLAIGFGGSKRAWVAQGWCFSFRNMGSPWAARSAGGKTQAGPSIVGTPILSMRSAIVATCAIQRPLCGSACPVHGATRKTLVTTQVKSSAFSPVRLPSSPAKSPRIALLSLGILTRCQFQELQLVAHHRRQIHV